MAFKPSFNAESGVVKILVRNSYASKFFEKTPSVEGGKLKYRMNGIMSKTTEEGKASIQVMNQAIRALIEKDFPGKDVKKFFEALDEKRKGLHDGDLYTNDDGDVREHYEGTRYVKLTNDKRPKYKNRRGEDLELDEAKELFVSGFWSVAYLHLYSVKDKAKGGNGIFVTVDAVQFYKRDEEFSGGGIDDDEIDDLGDDEDEGDDLTDNKPKKPAAKKSSSIDDDDDLGV